jgi:hypothetical protein
MEENKRSEGLFDYCENVLGYKKLWRGDIKASYLIDGFVQVDFKELVKYCEEDVQSNHDGFVKMLNVLQ